MSAVQKSTYMKVLNELKARVNPPVAEQQITEIDLQLKVLFDNSPEAVSYFNETINLMNDVRNHLLKDAALKKNYAPIGGGAPAKEARLKGLNADLMLATESYKKIITELQNLLCGFNR